MKLCAENCRPDTALGNGVRERFGVGLAKYLPFFDEVCAPELDDSEGLELVFSTDCKFGPVAAVVLELRLDLDGLIGFTYEALL